MRQIGFVRVEEQKLRPGKEGIESGGWLRAKTKHGDCLQMTEACVCSLWSPGFKQGSQGNGKISLQKENNTFPLGFFLLQMSNFSFLNDFEFTERWKE